MIPATASTGMSANRQQAFDRLARKGLLVCLFFVGGFLSWSATAPLISAVVAPGVVKIWTNRKTVQHLEGGIVRVIYVADGSQVVAGDPLILLEDTTTSSALNILTDQRDTLLIQEQRLLAERISADHFKLSDELRARCDHEPRIEAIYESERSVFEVRRKHLDEQIRLLREGIEHAQQATVSAGAEIAAIKEGLGYTGELVQSTETMNQRGFVERAMLLQKKEALAQREEELHAQTGHLAELRKEIVEQEIRIIALRNSYMEDAEVERKQTHAQLLELEERLRPARNAQERSLVRAPIAGQVMALQVSTIGGVIRPGDPLLDIVPNDSQLIVEVKVSNQDIDNVHLGQRAEVQLNAFNRQTTPLVDGEVNYVAGDAEEDPRLPSVLYFKTNIQLDHAQLERLGDINLVPGMPVTAFIKIRARTLLDYLISPITDHLRRALREE